MDKRETFINCVKTADFSVVITLNKDTFNLFSNLPSSDKTIDFVLQAVKAFMLNLSEQEKYDSVDEYAKRKTDELLSKISKKDIDKDLH